MGHPFILQLTKLRSLEEEQLGNALSGSELIPESKFSGPRPRAFSTVQASVEYRKVDGKPYLTFCRSETSLPIFYSLMTQAVKNPPAVQKTWVQSLGWEDPLEKGMATHSSILVWRSLMDRGAWHAPVHESDTNEHTYFSLVLPAIFSSACFLVILVSHMIKTI